MSQQLGHVIHAANTATNRQRDEYLVGRARDRVQQDLPSAGCRGDVEKHELVRALAVVQGGQLGRIPGITQLAKTDALHDTPGVHVQAGDHALCGHARHMPRKFL